MLTTLSVMLLVTYLLLYRYFFAGSYLGFNVGARRLSGMIFLFYQFVFIMISLILVPLLGPDQIRTLSHNVTVETLEGAVLIVWYGLFLFALTFWLLSLRFGDTCSYDGHEVLAELEDPATRSRVLFFARFLAIGILLILCFTIFVQGGKHAFLYGLMQNLAPGGLRHMNASIAGLSYMKHFINVCCLMLSIILALPIYRRRRVEQICLFLVIGIGATFYGSKSPLVFNLIAFALASIELRQSLNMGILIRRLALALVLLFGIFFFIVIQAWGENADITVFFDYFWNRAFIGQMAGHFEQWNLELYDETYVLHAIPFASLATDYPVFHKDLMLISENRTDPDGIGIKVTYYIAEAYAMLGTPGIILSPVIMAIQFTTTYLALSWVLRKMAFGTPALSRFTAAYFFVSFFSTTDGLSEMLLFKGLIVIAIILVPACLATWLVSHRPQQYGYYTSMAQTP